MSQNDASRTAFALLADGQWAGGMQVREADIAVAGGPVLHALEGPVRLLLVPLEPDEPDVLDEGSRGVVLRPRDMVDGEETRRFQTIVCVEPALNLPFETFCDEILEALSTSPQDPARRCVDVLERWRDLLGPRSSRLLGANALSGLLAELHLLERLVHLGGAASSLPLWMGPTGARFDFMGGAVVAEVKATTSRDRFTVSIHGLLQLEAPKGETLLLYAEQLERVPMGGDSVPDAVERLVAAGTSRQPLLAALEQLGAQPADMDAYGQVRFRELDLRAFEVTDDFPRLVRSGLIDPGMADRVSNVTYSIDLSDVTMVPGHLADVDDVARRLLQA